jgi:hypothetical protein
VIDLSELESYGIKEDGVIGGSHFDVTINYPQSKMWLEPNGEPFKTNINSFGFMSKKDEKGDVKKIIGLWKGSSAQKKD